MVCLLPSEFIAKYRYDPPLPPSDRLLYVTCSASSLLMANASWSCRSSSPELCGQACSGSAPPEWEPNERLPPRPGAEGAEEAERNEYTTLLRSEMSVYPSRKFNPKTTL